jgi:hypothetical protein
MKKKIIGLVVCMFLIGTTIPAVESLKIPTVQNTSNNAALQKLSYQQKALIFGEITNLWTYEETIVFQAVKIKVVTFFPFSFNPYTSGEYFEILKEYKGFIGVRFIFALTTLYTPEIACIADSFIDRIFITLADANINWKDIAITLDKRGATYQVFYYNGTAIAPVNNTASAGVAQVTDGQYIQLSTYKGNVTTTLRYIPTGISFGTWIINV